MSTLTTPDGILVPATSDTSSWQMLMAAQSGTIQDALNKRQVHAYRPADAAALAALAGTYTLQAGDTADKLDDGSQWRYSGSAWVQVINSSGLNLVVPTSAAVGSGSQSISSTGVVTFTGASSVSINGAFSSSYNTYKVIVDIPTTSATCTLSAVLRAAGTDATAAQYDIQVLQGTTSTAAAAQAAAQTFWGFNGGVTGTIHFIEVELARPAALSPTLGFEFAYATQNPLTASGMAFRGLSHRLSNAYDGMTITAAGGTITGTVSVYGYAK